MSAKLKNIKKQIKNFSEKELYEEYKNISSLTKEELLKKYNTKEKSKLKK